MNIQVQAGRAGDVFYTEHRDYPAQGGSMAAFSVCVFTVNDDTITIHLPYLARLTYSEAK